MTIKNKNLYLDQDGDTTIVEETFSGYSLIQEENIGSDKKMKPYSYMVLDPNENVIGIWTSSTDALGMPTAQYKASIVKRIFDRMVSEEVYKKHQEQVKKATKSRNTQYKQMSLFDDDDDYYTPNYYGGYRNNYHYEAPKPKTGYLDKLNKSDTLVIHKTDPTTTMLSQIYDGKGWDVLNDTYIDKDELHELIKNHDKIIMLGHGSGYGLMGGNIGPEEAPLLADKKLFVIWCNADEYFNRYLPEKKNFFCTKNAPSEVWECRAAGCGNISSELMLENITYWCKVCGDVVEECLAGNINSSVDYIRKSYLEKYGNHPVSIYNADSAHNKGYNKPLPSYEFKGEPLKPKDYPYSGFDEEEFLKNPVPYAKK